MRASAGRLAAGCVVAALLGACGGTAPHPSAGAISPTPQATSPTPQACASPPASKAGWPSVVPRTFPLLPGAQDFRVTPGQAGLKVVQFSAPISLRQAVLFVLKELPPAGYVLARGDSEAFEADAPFAGSGVRGLLRIDAHSACVITGLLAIVAQGARAPSELLPAHDTSPSASG